MTETREKYEVETAVVPVQSLVVRDEALMPSTVEGVKAQAQELVKSGLLPDHVKTAQQAFAIITMGRELGIPPMQSLRSIYVVGGQPHLNAQMIGALIYKAGHSYQTDVLTEQECTITFKRRDGAIYTHTVTMQEAQRLNWDKDYDKATGRHSKDKWAWKRYPKALLFARCLSAGARVHMPDAIHNMYAIVTDERGTVIDAEVGPVPEYKETPTQPAPQELAEHNNETEDPAEMEVANLAESIRAQLQASAVKFKAGRTPSDNQLGLLVGKVGEALQDRDDKPRHLVFRWLWGEESSKRLTYGAVGAMLKRWVQDKDESGDYPLAPNAVAELAAIKKQAEIEAGQLEFGKV